MQWFWLPLAAALELSAESHSQVAVRAQAHSSLRLGLGRPEQFLLISSPGGQKVCWAKLGPGADAVNIYPLIDSGLTNPRGIALDEAHGRLYIADPSGQAIFSYNIELKPCTYNAAKNKANGHAPADATTEEKNACMSSYNEEPTSDREQLLIRSGVEPQWVTVDKQGNLYYTDKPKNEVMRISRGTLEMLEAGTIKAGDLRTKTEAEAEAEARVAENRLLVQSEPGAIPTPEPPPTPIIDTLYSVAGGATGIAAPSGIFVDGTKVMWGNEASGTTDGSIVEGHMPHDSSSVLVLSSNTNKVFGVTGTSSEIFYTDNTMYVYGMRRSGGEVTTMIDSLQQPRGIVWDGDGTIYIADQAGNMVYSFPSGRLHPASTTRVVGLDGAFGLAVLTSGVGKAAGPSSAAALCAMLLFW